MSPNAKPKRTPLYDRHVALGAKIVPFSGWEMPVQYQGITREHLCVRQHAGVFDVSHMAIVEVTGPDALAYLESLVPNRVSRLKPGQALYTQLLNREGGTLDDLIIYALQGRYFLVVNAGNTDQDLAWLNAQRKGDVAVNHLRDWGLLALQGPEAEKILAPLVPADLSLIPYFGLWEGDDLIVSRTGYTGEDGFELFLPPGKLLPLWDRLMAAHVTPCGLGARDTLRLEAAYPLYGHELDASTTPLEAGLAWTVKLEKGDFLGREALKARSLQKKLVGFHLEGRAIPRQGYPILQDGEPVGEVTSGTLSPVLDTPIGLGYLPPNAKGPFAVEIRGKQCPLKMVALPFYRGSARSR